ncbi:MAG TPA: agmatine deiminase family protein [Chitinophagales bacterium]|nr:agmatine deiminase family protein [Chitinophagales bacterium]HRG87109.1 agmatine deiminase family protein [Chitinophagales bacterium]
MKKLTPVLMLMCFAQYILAQTPTYTFPAETLQHEGTWLQWPHHYTYGTTYRSRLDQTFIDMTAALVGSEKVFIVAYNNTEKNRIIDLLNTAGIPLGNIFFYIIKTDDVWSRDNGPMYVYNEDNELVILDWKFNGWGNDTPYAKVDKVPQRIAEKTGVPRVNLSAMVLEGGAVEVDGAGTFLATRSSISGDNRNPTLTETDINNYLQQYLGVSNIIWLDGLYGGALDITDTHIDGFAKFLDSTTLVTMNSADLSYWGISTSDITTLMTAENANGDTYNKIYLPLTNKNVKTTWGANVGFKSSYNNYYVGNNVVLATTFNDANDDDALAILSDLYPDKTIVGIDCRNLYFYGGMVHCVTQQQPIGLPLKSFVQFDNGDEDFPLTASISPNPASDITQITISGNITGNAVIEIYALNGALVYQTEVTTILPGNTSIAIDVSNFENGNYIGVVKNNNTRSSGFVITVTH